MIGLTAPCKVNNDPTDDGFTSADMSAHQIEGSAPDVLLIAGDVPSIAAPPVNPAPVQPSSANRVASEWTPTPTPNPTPESSPQLSDADDDARLRPHHPNPSDLMQTPASAVPNIAGPQAPDPSARREHPSTGNGLVAGAPKSVEAIPSPVEAKLSVSVPAGPLHGRVPEAGSMAAEVAAEAFLAADVVHEPESAVEWRHLPRRNSGLGDSSSKSAAGSKDADKGSSSGDSSKGVVSAHGNNDASEKDENGNNDAYEKDGNGDDEGVMEEIEELALSLAETLEAPMGRLVALQQAERQALLQKELLQKRIVRTQMVIRDLSTSVHRVHQELALKRPEIASLWRLQLLSLRIGQHVWHVAPTQHSAGAWEQATLQTATLERKIIAAISAARKSGIILVGDDGETSLDYNSAEFRTTVAANKLPAFIPSPKGDDAERRIIEAFFEPSRLIFRVNPSNT